MFTTTLVAILAIVELSFFLIYDLRMSRGNRTARYVIRLMSCAGGLLLIVSDLLLSPPLDMQELAADFTFSMAILVIYPCSFEKPEPSLKSSTFLAVTGIFAMLFFCFKPPGTLGFKSQRIVCSVGPIIFLLLLHFLCVAYRKFSGIRSMFRNVAVWHSVEDYSRFLYSIGYLGTLLLFLCAVSASGHLGEALTLMSLLISMALYALLFLRASTGRTYMIKVATEKRIKDIIKGNLRTSYIDKSEEDAKMNNLYRRVIMYMEERKPYLDQDFDMSVMADSMLTNKLYLSKTINILSGRNFRQFVNYYRIQRAMALMKEDPKLRVSEVAEMSGFHSSVSFNMAFKVNTGKTPSEWIHNYVAESD